MDRVKKYILPYILLNVAIAGTAFLLYTLLGINMVLHDIFVLSLLFTAVSAITLAIFSRGRSREPGSRTMHTFVSVSLKFLLDMILALFWFILSKKTEMTSVFAFFVIYLTLTLFTIIFILKSLRNRSL